MKEKISKLEFKGWLNNEDKKWNIPSECPICKGKLGKVDAIGLIGVMFIYCKNSKCRWSQIYEE